jgi:hypothetical protein
MSDGGRVALRQFSQQLLTAFLRSAEAATADDMVAAVPAFLASSAAYVLLDAGFRQLHQVSSADLLIAQRGDAFQRLMAHPLSDAFVAGELSRDMIPGYFSFLHLVLGDSLDAMGRECQDILAELKREPFFTWDVFYDDLRSQRIVWNALARIAESFRRFELRRDWFIGLMQNRPHAVSLSANAFLPLTTHTHAIEEAHPFALPQFMVLFRCLYGPLRDLPADSKAAFQQAFGAVPEQVFQAIYKNLG